MILGIDTSNYTTSAALLDTSGKLIAQKRERLEVEQGERGLRQSEAVFQHVKKLPQVIAKVAEGKKEELTKLVVSTSPTSQQDSYMPVFRVGEGQARSLASILGLSLLEVSHQEGHLMAGVWSSGLDVEEFLAVHLSGGTSELLKVSKKQGLGFEVEVLGTSQDLHAGQFIDRVGVELGLPFPAGPSLEELAVEGELGEVVIPSAVDGYQISFSGPTSAAMRAIEAGEKKANIALAVQQAIANTVEKVLRKAIGEEELTEILIVGGVAANQYLRERLRKRLEHPGVGAELYFAEPKWSSDNAVGTAALALGQ
ncbi:O-sialoglycoprotein endopeptidase [Natroniella acetigena]|uniref:Kae1-like domain-containing protein n=1 Tax=Natroniella acetigena TaxID=52004 RepID=UPI00200B1897|nr:O-sialoglycoprotein endopeptidase [Natroniella acetigena]MCK8826626.1 O-sialoglycoprotein endopeptidase [Natroniella acetigena]